MQTEKHCMIYTIVFKCFTNPSTVHGCSTFTEYWVWKEMRGCSCIKTRCYLHFTWTVSATSHFRDFVLSRDAERTGKNNGSKTWLLQRVPGKTDKTEVQTKEGRLIRKSEQELYTRKPIQPSQTFLRFIPYDLLRLYVLVQYYIRNNTFPSCLGCYSASALEN